MAVTCQTLKPFTVYLMAVVVWGWTPRALYILSALQELHPQAVYNLFYRGLWKRTKQKSVTVLMEKTLM